MKKRIEEAKIYKYLPLIMGLLLGGISILMGLIPNGIRQFTGLTVIGNNEGYLLGALIIAWLHHKSWVKSFLWSGFMIIVATITYYIFIFAFNIFGVQSESHASNLRGLLFWSVIAVLVGLLAATGVWMARKAASKILNYGIFAVACLSMFGVIYLYRVRMVLNLYRFSAFGSALSVRQFVGSIFEIGVAVVLTIIVLGIGFKHMRDDAKTR